MTAPIRSIAASLLLLLLLACPAPPPEQAALWVYLSGVPAGTQALEVETSLIDPGDPSGLRGTAPRTERLPGEQRSLRLLPPALSGRLLVKVWAWHDNGCQLGEGFGRADLGGPRELAIELNTLAAGRCRLVVERLGPPGPRVLSEPPGIDCPGRCEENFPLGQMVRLRIEERGATYFNGWAGACAGRGACAVPIGQEATRVVANLVPPRVCSTDGWCFETPYPSDYVLRALWSLPAEEDVWTVGDVGLVMRWNGAFWGQFAAGTREDLRAVWGSGVNDVWVVGDGATIRRWDGVSFTPVPAGTTRRLSGIWGSAPDDVWVVGDKGTILRWDGQSFSRHDSGTTQDLYGVWGSRRDDVWVVGDSGPVLHWDGASWHKINIESLFGGLRAVWGTGSRDVWVGGESSAVFRWDGERFQEHRNSPVGRISAIWGRGPDDVWVTGDVLGHWYGGQWRVFRSPDIPFIPVGLAGGRDRVWGGGSNMAQFDGQGLVRGPTWPSGYVSAMHGSGTDNVWIASDRGSVYRWLGGTFQELQTGSTGNVGALWVAGPDNVWVGGLGQVRRWNGKVWSVMDVGVRDYVVALWGSGQDMWALAGSSSDHRGAVLRLQGGSWAQVDVGPVRYLSSLWGSGPNDVWVGGEDGTLLRWDGAAWQPVTGAEYRLSSISGSSKSDVWICGNIDLYRWDGGSLRRVPSTERPGTPARGWTAASGEFFGLVETGYLNSAVVRFDASGWRLQSTGLKDRLRDLWGSGPRDLWAVGQRGDVLRYRP